MAQTVSVASYDQVPVKEQMKMQAPKAAEGLSNKRERELLAEIRTLKSRIARFEQVERECKTAQAALGELDIAYKLLVDATGGTVYRGNPDWSVRDLLGCDNICGYTRNEINSREQGWLDIVHPADKNEVFAAGAEQVKEKKSVVQVYRILDKNGAERWVEDHKTSCFSEDGEFAGIHGFVQEITEYKLAKEKERSARDELCATLNAIPDLLFVVDQAGCMYDFRAPRPDLLYVSPEAFLGKKVSEVLPPEAAQTIMQAVAEAAETGLHRGATYCLDMPDGLKWFELSVAAKNRSAVDSRFVILARDITEHKLARGALKDSEERLRTAMAAAEMGTWKWDTVNDLDTRDASLNRILGLGATESTQSAEDFVQRIHPEDRAKVVQEMHGAMDEQRTFSAEFRIVCPDGTEKWLYGRGLPYYDENKKLSYMTGAVVDITEKRRREEEYETLIETSMEGFWMVDAAGRLLDVNDAYAKTSGYSRNELLEMKIWDIDVSESPEEIKEHVRRVMEQGSDRFESRHRTKDRGIIDVEVCSQYRDYAGGRFYGFVRDISERKKAEKALLKSKQSLNEAQRIAHLGSWEWNVSTDDIELSDETYRIFGLKPQEFELSLADFMSFVHPEDCTFIQKAIEGILSKQVEESYEFRICRRNGDVRWLKSMGHLMLDEENVPGIMIGALLDITETKQVEERIKASLREKEILLREIHHRVKNNLQVISSLLNLQVHAVKDKQVLEVFRESQDRIRAMTLIHEKLYQSDSLARVCFADYAQDLAESLYSSYGVSTARVALTVNIDNVALNLDTAIPCSLIVHELLSNALKYAFPEGSRGELALGLHAGDDETCVLTIRDNGVGMPKDLDIRKTETLGLQLVMSLTKQLQGEMSLDRRDGTEFKFTFPQPSTTKKG